MTDGSKWMINGRTTEEITAARINQTIHRAEHITFEGLVATETDHLEAHFERKPLLKDCADHPDAVAAWKERQKHPYSPPKFVREDIKSAEKELFDALVESETAHGMAHFR